VTSGVRVATGSLKGQPGVPVGMIFFVGSVVLLAAAGDVRMLVRGGVSGRQRVVRHLWRMCFGLFIATGSFFIGQHKYSPLSYAEQIYFLSRDPALVLMIFWLIRVRFKNAYKRKSVPGSRDVHSLPA